MRSLSPFKFENVKITIYYHIYLDGKRITNRPLSVAEIKTCCGSVRRLERAGFKVVKAVGKI